MRMFILLILAARNAVCELSNLEWLGLINYDCTQTEHRLIAKNYSDMNVHRLPRHYRPIVFSVWLRV